jgi:uncharacterized protein YcbX
MSVAEVAELYRYPVKGLSPQSLPEAMLESGRHFPGDRLFALENGPSRYDPARPAFRPKTRFLMLMKNERLALLRTKFDAESGILNILPPGGPALTFAIADLAERRKLEEFIEGYCAGELNGPVRLLDAAGDFRFTDSSRAGFLSILNLASISDLSSRAGAALDPLRFRANLHLHGMQPWTETEWVGRSLKVDGVELEILKTIDRCLATHVDPRSGRRDVDVTGALRRSFGHVECGVYARVKTGGLIRTGSLVSLA